MERDGDGENLNFAGMVEGVRVLVWVLVVVWVRVSVFRGCNLASISTIKEYFCTCFVVVYYWVVWVFLYLWRVVPFRGWWRPCGVGGLVVVGWWCGGAGGGGGWQGYTPLFICIVGTIRGFGMRKFFFEFWGRLAWCGAECDGEGVEG